MEFEDQRDDQLPQFSVYKTKRYRIVPDYNNVEGRSDPLSAEIRFDLAKIDNQPIRTVTTKLIVYDKQSDNVVEIELDQLQIERLIEVMSIGLDPDTGFYKL